MELRLILRAQAPDFSREGPDVLIKLGWKAALVVAIAFAVVTVACSAKDDVPLLERRAQQLNKVIMCPACPGESIDQSQNDLAVNMRAIVREKLEQGWTDDQIKSYFVEGYDTYVLLEPPREGFSLVVWILPPVGVLGAALALFTTMRLMRRPSTAQTQRLDEGVQLSKAERDVYFRRIEIALDYDEGRTAPEENDEVAHHGTKGAG